LKIEGIDSVKAFLNSYSIYNFGTDKIPVCEFIKIRINPANSDNGGYVAVVYKYKGYNTECVKYLYSNPGTAYLSEYGPLQWEYK